MDQDDRLLHDLVSAFHGNRPIFPVHPYLLFTSDNKTQYIFEGTLESKKKDEWILATESPIKGRDTRALYAHDDSNLMNGVRVKLNFNFSGAGTSSAICITVTGLTDHDMPKEDCIALAMEGLCIGEANVNLQNKGVGYVLLMKSKADAEKERFKFIRDHISIPFVNASRKEFGKYDQLCDGPIPVAVKQTAVSWFDGDNSQIAVVKSEPEIYSKNKIIANKHNAGRTGTEQGDDLT